jgi:hypothetical protein
LLSLSTTSADRRIVVGVVGFDRYILPKYNDLVVDVV